jgi:hypothetical protein
MEHLQNILIILVITGLVAFFALRRKKSRVIDSLPDPKEITIDLKFWAAEYAKEYGPYNADNLPPSDSELESYARQRIAGGYVRS